MLVWHKTYKFLIWSISLILYSRWIALKKNLLSWNFHIFDISSMFVQLFDINKGLAIHYVFRLVEKSIRAFNILSSWKKNGLIFIRNIYARIIPELVRILQESHFIFKERAGSSGPLVTMVRCSLQRTERESFVILADLKDPLFSQNYLFLFYAALKFQF